MYFPFDVLFDWKNQASRDEKPKRSEKSERKQVYIGPKIVYK